MSGEGGVARGDRLMDHAFFFSPLFFWKPVITQSTATRGPCGCLSVLWIAIPALPSENSRAHECHALPRRRVSHWLPLTYLSIHVAHAPTTQPLWGKAG